MADPQPPAYWDSNVFLGYLEGTPGQVEAVDALLNAAALGRGATIVTSILSVTEVAFVDAERRGGRPDPGVEAVLDRLWRDPTLQLLGLDLGTTVAARNLMRQPLMHGPRLKPPDALHLASAQRAGAAAFYTYHIALLRLSGRLGSPILPPPAQG